jgi:hypothetical protein
MWIGTGIFLALVWGMGFGDGMSNYDNRIVAVKKASDLKYEK